jgi:hypothetical protein
MEGMSGYFYNRLPNPERIASTVAAMRRFGLRDLAALLDEAFQLFDLPSLVRRMRNRLTCCIMHSGWGSGDTGE